MAPGTTVSLPRDFDTAWIPTRLSKASAAKLLAAGLAHLAELQDRLYSQDTYGVLFILQAMDAAGKDGIVKHVMTGLNPQGVHVTSFKAPSELERDHTYLWRAQTAVPARGMIGIFNRSHDQDVLIVRVHPELLAGSSCPSRLAQGTSGRGGTQRSTTSSTSGGQRHPRGQDVPQRGQGRAACAVPGPDRRSLEELEVLGRRCRGRGHWDEYQKAFAKMISATSTDWAPWYVVPADRKWFARLSAAAILAHTLIEIDRSTPCCRNRGKRARGREGAPARGRPCGE